LYDQTGDGAPTSTPNSYKRIVRYYDSTNHLQYHWQPELQTWKADSTNGGSANIILDSVVISADGLHPEITFPLTQTGFKDVNFYYEDKRAGGFQQAHTDTEGVLNWAASVKGSFKIFIVYYFGFNWFLLLFLLPLIKVKYRNKFFSQFNIDL
jgi:hypothetical protein